MQVETPRLIRMPEVRRMTGLGRSQTYQLTRDGRFPAPVKLSERCVAWNSADVQRWIDERIASAKIARAAA